jgi:outer membrane scaffolding protein for murein synthesis (MipA/OmpV family)
MRPAALALALFLAAALPTAALAADSPQTSGSSAQTGAGGEQNMQKLLNEDHYYFAVGPSWAPDYEGSDDYNVYPLVIGRWDGGGRFAEFDGDTLRVNAIPAILFQAGPALVLRQGRQGVADDRVHVLRHVRSALEAGGFVGLEIRDPKELRRYADLRLQAVQDVTGVSDGYDARLNLRAGGPLGDPWSIDTELFSDYGSKDYMNTYFSIDANNAARSGFPVYHASEGFRDVGLNAMLTYHFSDHWGVGLIGEYKRLIGDAANSPVVENAGSPDQFVTALTITFEY